MTDAPTPTRAAQPSAAEVLAELQWSARYIDRDHGNEWDGCPCCQQSEDDGHAPDCRLARHLNPARQDTPATPDATALALAEARAHGAAGAYAKAIFMFAQSYQDVGEAGTVFLEDVIERLDLLRTDFGRLRATAPAADAAPGDGPAIPKEAVEAAAQALAYVAVSRRYPQWGEADLRQLAAAHASDYLAEASVALVAALPKIGGVR